MTFLVPRSDLFYDASASSKEESSQTSSAATATARRADQHDYRNGYEPARMRTSEDEVALCPAVPR